MKILHIYDEYDDPKEGSVPYIIYYISKHMLNKNHDITVLVLEDKNAHYSHFGPNKISDDNFKLIKLKVKRIVSKPYNAINKILFGYICLILDGIITALLISKYIKKNDFDIIHFHFPFTAYILINIYKQLRKKAIYTAHIGEERKRFALDSTAPFFLRIFAPDVYLMKRIQYSVVLNEPLKEKLLATGIKQDKLEVIPHGINIDDFIVKEDKIEKIKNKYKLKYLTVLFVGAIIPRKGVIYLIKSAEILKEFNITYIVVGNTNRDRKYAQNLINYVKKSNISVTFTGFLSNDEVRALYSACDVFILPSLEEGFGLVLTEALASGKPLIGTNVGGIPLQIKDGWNGFLVEPCNEKQLAKKLKYFIDNKDEILRMGRNSRKLAETKFNWSSIAEKYLRIYENIYKTRLYE